MSIQNVCFYAELTKIIFKLSSNTLLICSIEGAEDSVAKFTSSLRARD